MEGVPSMKRKRTPVRTPVHKNNSTLPVPSAVVRRNSAPSSPNQSLSTPEAVSAKRAVGASKHNVMFLTPQPAGRKQMRKAPRSHSNLETDDQCDTDDMPATQKMTVALRVRPHSQLESRGVAKEVALCVGPSGKTVTLTGQQLQREFAFEVVFADGLQNESQMPASANELQAEVYAELGRPLLDNLLAGYNCTLFAYGQTGSGKTFSVSGTDEAPGIVPRICEELFARMLPRIHSQDCTVEVAYFEIYQEKVSDLLSGKADQPPLRLREHPVNGPFLEGLSRIPVANVEDLNKWIQLGMQNRATATTGMNEKSSRSHSILQLFLTQIEREMVDDCEQQFKRYSQLNLVDLAGSERSNSAQEGAANKDERYKETIAINGSLFCLKRVISILANAERTSKIMGDRRRSIASDPPHVPYRDSVLTQLLKESLVGNARTVLLTTVSPCASQKEETLSTLRFASDAAAVRTRPTVNVDQTLALIRRMRQLKIELDSYKENGESMEVATVRAENDQLKAELQAQTKRYEEGHRLFEAKLGAANLQLADALDKRSNVCLFGKFDEPAVPALAELASDPSLALVCSLSENGTVSIGSASLCTLRVYGDRIRDVHCRLLKGADGVWMLESGDADSELFVNGEEVFSGKTALHNLDRICLSGERYFLALLSSTMDGEGVCQVDSAIHTYAAAKAEYLSKQLPIWEKRIREETISRVEAEKKEVVGELAAMLEGTKKKCDELDSQLRSVIEQKGRLESERELLIAENSSAIRRLREERTGTADELTIIQRRLLSKEEELRQLAQRHKALLEVEKITNVELETVVSFKETMTEKLKQSARTLLPSSDYEDGTDEETGSPSAKQRRTMVSVVFDVQQANAYLKRLGQLHMFRFHCEEKIEGLADGGLQPKLCVRLDNVKSKIHCWLTPTELRERLSALRDVAAESEPDAASQIYPILFNETANWTANSNLTAKSSRSSDLVRIAVLNTVQNTARKTSSPVAQVRRSLAKCSAALSGRQGQPRQSTISAILDDAKDTDSLTDRPTTAFETTFMFAVEDLLNEGLELNESCTGADNLLVSLVSVSDMCQSLKPVADSGQRISVIHMRLVVALHSLKCHLQNIALNPPTNDDWQNDCADAKRKRLISHYNILRSQLTLWYQHEMNAKQSSTLDEEQSWDQSATDTLKRCKTLLMELAETMGEWSFYTNVLPTAAWPKVMGSSGGAVLCLKFVAGVERAVRDCDERRRLSPTHINVALHMLSEKATPYSVCAVTDAVDGVAHSSWLMVDDLQFSNTDLAHEVSFASSASTSSFVTSSPLTPPMVDRRLIFSRVEQLIVETRIVNTALQMVKQSQGESESLEMSVKRRRTLIGRIWSAYPLCQTTTDRRAACAQMFHLSIELLIETERNHNTSDLETVLLSTATTLPSFKQWTETQSLHTVTDCFSLALACLPLDKLLTVVDICHTNVTDFQDNLLAFVVLAAVLNECAKRHVEIQSGSTLCLLLRFWLDWLGQKPTDLTIEPLDAVSMRAWVQTQRDIPKALIDVLDDFCRTK